MESVKTNHSHTFRRFKPSITERELIDYLRHSDYPSIIKVVANILNYAKMGTAFSTLPSEDADYIVLEDNYHIISEKKHVVFPADWFCGPCVMASHCNAGDSYIYRGNHLFELIQPVQTVEEKAA